jgi:cobalt-zinc-cadmium efflux system protein
MNHAHTHNTEDTVNRATTRRLGLSLGFTLLFVAVEIAAGIFSHSLALLTDAAHNITDVITLALTMWAFTMALKPAHSGKTYGYHRAGILVALVNSSSLALIAGGIFVEAIRRIINPPEVNAGILIWVSLAAVVVNLVTALLVRRGSDSDLNLKSAFLHLMGDVFSTVGALVAGIIIHFTDAYWLDPLVSILIGFLILWNAWGILRESVHILMESTPSDINIEKLINDIQAVQGVRGLHDLHIWSLNQSRRTLSAHIVVDDVTIKVGAQVQTEINRLLEDNYEIYHATLQLECPGCSSGNTYCTYC